MTNCPYCSTQVASFKFNHLDLRICPKCFSTFFPCSQTMAFRSDLTDKSRELWLKALLKKNLSDPNCSNICCIDHNEPLIAGTLPDYGFDGLVTTCCKMFHLPPSLTIKLLKRTLEHPFKVPAKEGKHHLFFICWLDAIINKIFGEKLPEDDPFDSLQYDIHLKPILDADND